MIIDSLEERTYEFEVFTRDPDENLSVFQTVSGRPVGDIFISSQSVRRITDYETIGDHTYVYWADKAESPYVVVTIISYETVDGDVVTQEISPDDNESILQSGWKPLSTGQVKSGVISGDNGIDTVFVDPVDITLPPPPFTLLDKTLHNLVWMPSDLPGTTNDEPNQFLFDKRGWIGDYESYHSGDNTGGTPAHITVDLGVNAVVRQVELGFREGYTGNNPVEFELWGIDDITNAETEGSDENEFIAKGWKKLYSSPVDPKQPGVKVDKVYVMLDTVVLEQKQGTTSHIS
jgi:hypothetical protein